MGQLEQIIETENEKATSLSFVKDSQSQNNNINIVADQSYVTLDTANTIEKKKKRMERVLKLRNKNQLLNNPEN